MTIEQGILIAALTILGLMWNWVLICILNPAVPARMLSRVLERAAAREVRDPARARIPELPAMFRTIVLIQLIVIPVIMIGIYFMWS